MRHLNYNHLFYFWTVAREGSVARAAETLHITPQTISGQIGALSEDIGHPVFRRVGRTLEITPVGEMVMRYADPIFSTGAELAERVRSGEIMQHDRLRVGAVNSLAKLTVEQILGSAIDGSTDYRVSCDEGDLEDLLADLALHRLDVVLSDRPVPSGVSVRAYSHKLGASPIGWFTSEPERLPAGVAFPDVLSKVDLVLPLPRHPLRRRIDSWFEARKWAPQVRAEFDDSALLKAFARQRRVVFPAPSAIAADVAAMYDCTMFGETPEITEEHYAITTERQISHPAIRHVLDALKSTAEGLAEIPVRV